MSNTKIETQVNIQINQKHFHVDVSEMTGAQIKVLGGIPDSNLLFREIHGPGDDEQIQDDTVVHLHDGDHFYDMPPGNFGSKSRGNLRWIS